MSNYEPTRAAVVIGSKLRLRGTEGNRFVRERQQPGVTVASVSVPTPVLAVLWLLSLAAAFYIDSKQTSQFAGKSTTLQRKTQ